MNPIGRAAKDQLDEHHLVACEQKRIVMVESGALEVTEEPSRTPEFGHDQIKRIIDAIRALHEQLKPNKVNVAPLPFDKALSNEIEAEIWRKTAGRTEHRKASEGKATSGGCVEGRDHKAVPGRRRRKAALQPVRLNVSRSNFPRTTF